MKNYNKNNYLKWFFFLVPIIIILIIYGLHFNYLYASTSEKSLDSFLENSRLALIDLKNIFYTKLTTSPIDIDNIDIPIFKLFVKADKIDKLNSQLPSPTYFGITHAPKDRVNGYIVYNDKTYFTRVRYRGDNYFHWRLPKKSWRVKLDKQIIDGVNQFNFINPKFDSHMNTQLSYYIADNIGLIAPRSYYTALFLNNVYNGVYYYTDQINEAFLRMKNKLPGTVYHGEITDDFYYLFNNSDYWDIKLAKEEGDEKSKEVFDFFLNNINGNDLTKFYDFFNRYLGEDYIKFDAFNMLIGSHQPDQFHNQKFYLNPSNAKFETIVWDPIPFIDEYTNLSLNYFNNPLILNMHLIPEFVHKRNKFIYGYMNNELSEENLIKVVDEWEKLIEYEMKYDSLKDAKEKPYTLTMNSWREAVEDLRNNIKERYKFLRDSLNEVDVTIYIVNEKIIFDINGENAVKCNNKLLYPGRKINEIDWGNIFNNKLDYAPLRYEYPLSEFDVSNIKIINDITGEKVIPKIVYLDNLNQLPLNEVNSIHPWKLKEKEDKTIIFDKDTILTKDLIIGKENTLIIKPGVDIKLGEGVSIISYGQIIAEGTKENPITFSKKDNKPWGSIIMQGIDRKNSKENYFKYCYINGGSGEEYEYVKYTGQVSVYNSIAYFENCKFYNNEIEDDNFNAKNSYIEINNCEINNSLMDGIDFDISEGKIINTKISNSGNDGLDIMTTNILIENNEIINSVDKGISVGEKSNPLIKNNKISNTNIGIAIKDMSDPIVTNNIIELNDVAIAAYHKNWRYEYGGRGKIYNNILNGNKKDYSVDKFSSEVDTEEGKKKLEDSNITIIDSIY